MDNDIGFLIPSYHRFSFYIGQIMIEKRTATELYDLFHELSRIDKDKIVIPMSTMLYVNQYLQKRLSIVDNNIAYFEKKQLALKDYASEQDRRQRDGLFHIYPVSDGKLDRVVENFKVEKETLETLLTSIRELIESYHSEDCSHPDIDYTLLYNIEHYLKNRISGIYYGITNIEGKIASDADDLERKIKEYNL